MKSWPSMSMGMSGGAVWIFSSRVSILRLLRMAQRKLKGAGTPGGKSNVVNSPGSSCQTRGRLSEIVGEQPGFRQASTCIAKIIWWIFHCSRS